MADHRAEVIVKWQADPEGGWTALLDYPGVYYEDVTNQRPPTLLTDPNVVSVLLERVDGAKLAAIGDDPNNYIIWQEEVM